MYAFQIAVIIFSLNLFYTDPSGKIHPEIINEKGNPNYKYFYTSADQGMYELHINWVLVKET